MKKIIGGLVIVGLIIAGGAYYLFNINPNKPDTVPDQIATTSEKTTATKSVDISKSTPTPIIPLAAKTTLLSPNGGEIFKQADTIKVSWAGISADHPSVFIALLKPNGQAIEGVFLKMPNTGYANLMIPQTVPDGVYSISVEGVDAPGQNSRADGPTDSSDAYFTISRNGSVLPTTHISSITDPQGNIFSSTHKIVKIADSPTVILHGSNFDRISCVKWSHNLDFGCDDKVTVSSDGTTLTTKVPAWYLEPGIHQVSVIGPGLPGNTFDFTITE